MSQQNRVYKIISPYCWQSLSDAYMSAAWICSTLRNYLELNGVHHIRRWGEDDLITSFINTENSCAAVVEGASQGRGRGRQVVAGNSHNQINSSSVDPGQSVAKTADLIIIMLDATKSHEQRRLLEIELDAVGIRINKRKPDVVFKKRTTGGVSFCLASLFHISLRMRF